MKYFIILFLFLSICLSAQQPYYRNLVGHWTFDNTDNLNQATIGNDLELVGEHTAVSGPEENNGAVSIGVGSYYKCFHDIPPNGNSADWVNIYTIVMDIKVEEIGQWYSLYQTNMNNSNDADWFINPTGHIGVGDTGYSFYSIDANQWYRLAISVNLGNRFDYYLDGQLLLEGANQNPNGRFALYPADNGNTVLFFADNNGEDNQIIVADIMLFDTDLSDNEIADLGGYGHTIIQPDNIYMASYLQSPTPNSIYISWHENESTQSIVEYGLSEALGLSANGSCIQFNSNKIWHTVKLNNLLPNTEYFYKCISDTANSDIRTFKTPPVESTGHFRFIVYGDSRTDAEKHTEIIHSIKETFQNEFGENIEENLNLVINVGDIVTTGAAVNLFQTEYFSPISSLSQNVPFMVSIGNHEGESQYFYDYMNYEDFQGSEGEKYYSFDMQNIRFIALNSNIQGETQLNWLQNLLDESQNNDNILWIFVFTHHPGRSEIWPEGNTDWVQNDIIPLLEEYSKVEALFYGHSHDYERGVSDVSNLRLLLSGGGGSALDRWGMYDNQTDYHEIHRSHDYYSYTIFDVNLSNNSYIAKSYSLGNTDKPMNNELFDTFFRFKESQPPDTPLALSPINTSSDVLVASPYESIYPIHSSHFQLTSSQDNWQNSIIDTIRHWENIYGDTGSPDYYPIDLNENIDLTRLYIPNLQIGGSYKWRIRYRNKNLDWSNWSEPVEFTFDEIVPQADFYVNINQGNAPLTVLFKDLSIGNVSSWQWDFDNDGTFDSNIQDPTFTFENAGEYTVTLKVTINNQEYIETKQNLINVVQAQNNPTEINNKTAKISICPNPFNPETVINFYLPEKNSVDISIYNLKGQKVKTFSMNVLEKGNHSIIWNGKNDKNKFVASGIYLMNLKLDGVNVKTAKMILLK